MNRVLMQQAVNGTLLRLRVCMCRLTVFQRQNKQTRISDSVMAACILHNRRSSMIISACTRDEEETETGPSWIHEIGGPLFPAT